jgi:transcriptional regulator with XRE-family HTH domain
LDNDTNAELWTYDPNHLLDTVRHKLNLNSDAQLSRTLEISQPAISKIRNMKAPVNANFLIRLHEVTNISIRELRLLMGDRRNKFRFHPKLPDFVHCQKFLPNAIRHKRRIDDAALQCIRRWLQEQPDLMLREIAERLAHTMEIHVSVSTLCRLLQRDEGRKNLDTSSNMALAQGR